jgi:hypothetical protein
VDALDLVQFYWHDYGVEKYVGAAQRLAELQEAGRLRHIGVTNFDVPRLAKIVDGGVRIVSHQVRAWRTGFSTKISDLKTAAPGRSAGSGPRAPHRHD